MGIEPTSEAWEAALPIMRLCCELVQICRAGLELAYSGRCGPPQPFRDPQGRKTGIPAFFVQPLVGYSFNSVKPISFCSSE
jgi:hypothetical protein